MTTYPKFSGALGLLVGLTVSGVAWAGDDGKTGSFADRVFAGGGKDIVELKESEMAGLRGAGTWDDFIANMLDAVDEQNTIAYTIDDGDTVTESGSGSFDVTFSSGSTTVDLCSSSCGSSGGGSFNWSSGSTSTTSYTFSYTSSWSTGY